MHTITAWKQLKPTDQCAYRQTLQSVLATFERILTHSSQKRKNFGSRPISQLICLFCLFSSVCGRSSPKLFVMFLLCRSLPSLCLTGRYSWSPKAKNLLCFFLFRNPKIVKNWKRWGMSFLVSVIRTTMESSPGASWRCCCRIWMNLSNWPR